MISKGHFRRPQSPRVPGSTLAEDEGKCRRVFLLTHLERKSTAGLILKWETQSSFLVRKELKTKSSVKYHIKGADEAR